jgi:TPR repeat protein
MPLFNTATLTFPPHGGQDRLAVEQFGDRIVLVVADGAGGIGGGAEAAQFVCDRTLQLARESPCDADGWAERLQTIDQELARSHHGGQATVVVAEVWNGQVCGASVGDSDAWLIDLDDDVLTLPAHEQRKPLLGSGSVRAHASGPASMNRRRLLLASDGLFRFASLGKLAHVARRAVTARAPSLLSDLARLPNGDLQDDVAIIVCDEDANPATVMREIDALLPRAQRGDPDACIELGYCYENLEQQEAATHWYKRATNAGSTEACYCTGVAYAKGFGVTQDLDLANHYYRLGAQRGSAMAINNLGYHYEDGNRGLAQDLGRALDCYRRAAELGAEIAQYNLGQAYKYGKFGLTPDLVRAAAYYRAAARAGHVDATVSWGDCLEKGLGVAVNHAKAMAQYRRAMNMGSARAVWRCGLLYELGLGVEQDFGQAARYYAEAAQHGCIGAQRCLGNMYRWGRGVDRDPALASLWLERAANAGDDEARTILREIVAQCGVPDQTA